MVGRRYQELGGFGRAGLGGGRGREVRGGRPGVGPGEGLRVVARQAARAGPRRALGRALVRRRQAARRRAPLAPAHALRGAGGAPRRAHPPPQVSLRCLPPRDAWRLLSPDCLVNPT